MSLLDSLCLRLSIPLKRIVRCINVTNCSPWVTKHLNTTLRPRGVTGVLHVTHWDSKRVENPLHLWSIKVAGQTRPKSTCHTRLSTVDPGPDSQSARLPVDDEPSQRVKTCYHLRWPVNQTSWICTRHSVSLQNLLKRRSSSSKDSSVCVSFSVLGSLSVCILIIVGDSGWLVNRKYLHT